MSVESSDKQGREGKPNQWRTGPCSRAMTLGWVCEIKEYRIHGEPIEKIAEQFELTPAVIAEVLDFADQHWAQVGAYMAEYQAELDRQEAAYQPSPAALRIGRLVKERHGAEAPQSES
ncbi:MAG: hypothetical protein ACLQIB_35915 [Isosphaeraceae bacterium]